MSYHRKLGLFVRVPAPGAVKTRLVPPLTEEEACRLYSAFLSDLMPRIARFKRADVVVFYTGGGPEPLRSIAPDHFQLVEQKGDTLGSRLAHAFDTLLADERDTAVVIGSDSPDLPLPFVKRAFQKLKHRDVVLGPASDGGYYLIGLKRRLPGLFDPVTWGTSKVLGETLGLVERLELQSALLPLWYDVDSRESLALLRSMMTGRRLERGGRLAHTERVLESLSFGNDES